MADGSGVSGYLGVVNSVTGRMWRERPACPIATRAHALRLGISEPLARALAARGVRDGEAETYLAPTLRALFPDPASFLGMEAAAETIVAAAKADRRIVIFADYDVDGAASAALLVRWLRAVGREAQVYVPDREREGYGPSTAAFRRLKAEGAELLVTVDCGAAAHEALETAAQLELPVVVIDHHLMRDGEAPPAAALVNPNQPGCGSGQGVLAAAGVVFVLLAALNREAVRQGVCAPGGTPDLLRWLDLAALGAVCDVTQLIGFNRALVAQGVKVMSRWENVGLKALLAAAGGQGAADVGKLGFMLGPRINAGGRIGRADLGVRLLATDDPEEAVALAEELDALNVARREIEREVTEAAAAQIERSGAVARGDAVLVAAGEGWRPGIVGVAAGRLRERFRRPAVVIGIDPAGVGRGSGRSQPGVNLGRAVQAAYAEGLLLSGGGHAMAAGLSVKAERIEEVRRFLNAALAEQQQAAAEAEAVDIDALIGGAAAAKALHDDLARLAPFGPGAPAPMAAMAGAEVAHVQALRGGHVRASLRAADGATLRAVAWRAAETPLGRRLLEGGVLHVAGTLKPDTWMGRDAVELEIEDVADPRRR